jgi:hypothetical protein
MPAKPPTPKDSPALAEEPHYHGHRERLRERFHSAGPDALSDYELLEMALFAAIPRRDTKPLAKALIKKFGSFAEVVHAPEARLREVDGIKDASVNQLRLIAAPASRIAKGEIKRSIALSSWQPKIGGTDGTRRIEGKARTNRQTNPWEGSAAVAAGAMIGLAGAAADRLEDRRELRRRFDLRRVAEPYHRRQGRACESERDAADLGCIGWRHKMREASCCRPLIFGFRDQVGLIARYVQTDTSLLRSATAVRNERPSPREKALREEA